MKRTLVLLAVLSLVGCATPPVVTPLENAKDASASNLTTLRNDGTLRALDVEEARALVSTGRLASASQLALLRPTPKKEVSSLEFEVVDGIDNVARRSVMHFTELQAGLQHVSHTMSPSPNTSELNEAFVDAYGIAPVLYWNSRFAQGGFPQSSEPDVVRLVRGRLFSIASGYVLEQTLRNGAVVTTDCKPSGEIPASAVHKNLTGIAAIFLCHDSGAVVSRVWYFEDHARYVTSEIEVNGEIQSRFRVTDTGFR